ncbi:MAG: hypothetical protein ABIQ93_16155 [Saprospiraceae bacterium]
MSAIDHKVIIYDDVCPMCQAYTAGFVRLGWLKHRTGFADASPALLQRIDLDRARHEIPLHDQMTGETLYGLDAMFFIIGERLPICKPLFRLRIFRNTLYILYQIITFNRRIIVGSSSPAAGFDCAPDVNRFYRWVYIALAAGMSWSLVNPLLVAGVSLLPAMLSLHAVALLLGLFLPKRLDLAGHAATMLLINMILLRLLPGDIFSQVGVFVLLFWMWRKRLALVA